MLRLAVCMGFLAAGAGASAQCMPQWATAFSQDGPSDVVSAVTEFDPDGPGPLPPVVVVGGDFELIGDTAFNHVAMWDGVSWRAMGAGFNGPVLILKVLDPDGPGPDEASLYAGGSFSGSIARWSGQAWDPIVISDIVEGIAVFDDDGAGPNPPMLYVGGRLGGFGYVARLNGAAWQTVGAGLNGWVNELSVIDEDGPGPMPEALYAGGSFTASGTTAALSVAKWNGAAWSALGPGFDGPVYAFASFDLDGTGPNPPVLCAAGNFGLSGTASCKDIAWWNGSQWQQIGSGLSGDVRALLVADDDGPGPRPVSLCAFGGLSVPNVPVDALRLDDATWVPMAPGFSLRLFSACVWNPGPGTDTQRLVVGGWINRTHSPSGPPPIFTPRLAQWDGVQWGPFGPAGNRGMDEMVWALATFDEDGPGPDPEALFVAGDFLSAGTLNVNRIVRWNGNGWSTVGNGTNGRVQTLLVFDEDGPGPGRSALFAGGSFTTAAGAPAAQVARWDGSNWSGLGTSGDVGIGSLAAVDLDGAGPGLPTLYAGGIFTTSELAVRAWTGSSWVPLPGLTGTLGALIEFDLDGSGPANPVLVAGGNLTINGSQTVRVATWNGQQWSALGDLPGTQAQSFAVFDEDGTGPNPARLFVGGNIAGAVKRWTGSAWTALGPGLNGSSVYAMTVFDEDGAGPMPPALFLGGWFFGTLTPPFPAITVTRIAKWNGSVWSPLGSGMSYDVRALAAFDEDGDGPRTPGLYAGGRFGAAGGRSSSFIARWGCGDLPICYPNCDGSSGVPAINVADYVCFMNRYAAGDPYANCDHSTATPVLNVADFICFMNSVAAGCP